MGALEELSLKIRRREGPFFDLAYRVASGAWKFNLPQTPTVRALARAAYAGHRAAQEVGKRATAILWSEPVFRSRCEAVGRNLSLDRVPFVSGHTKIYIGDNVSIMGDIGICSGRFCDEPKLVIGDNVSIGHGVGFTVNKLVEIGDHTSIAAYVNIVDSDGHPTEWERRMNNDALTEDEIRPVRIGKHVWIGTSAHIMKGVTIGDRAIVGAGSVVINDVPEDMMAMGSPARLVKTKTS